MNMTIKYEGLVLTLVTLKIPLFLDVTLCLNGSHPEVAFKSYNVQISVKHNNSFLLKITLEATCFSSVVVNVDFGSVDWKGLMMAL
jgi:spore coat protein U-like protein